jgi:hypothetical protein
MRFMGSTCRKGALTGAVLGFGRKPSRIAPNFSMT